MELQVLNQYFRLSGFSLIGAARLSNSLISQLPQQLCPLSDKQQGELLHECQHRRDLITALFPIPAGAAGAPDPPLPGKNHTADVVAPCPPGEASLYRLTAPFARIHYYRFIVKQLKQISRKIRENDPRLRKSDIRIFCNSQLPEKLLALLCGLGTIGKNNLLMPDRGSSALLIGGILLPEGTLTESGGPIPEASVKPLPRPGTACGNCNLCREACPVKALSEETLFCRKKCLQYISSREGLLPDGANRKAPLFYGCTLCQTACPHYRETEQGVENFRRAVEAGTPTVPTELSASKIAGMPESQAEVLLDQRLKGTAPGPRWISRKALIRNLKAVAGQGERDGRG